MQELYTLKYIFGSLVKKRKIIWTTDLPVQVIYC